MPPHRLFLGPPGAGGSGGGRSITKRLSPKDIIFVAQSSRDFLIRKIRGFNPKADFNLIEKAFKLMLDYHGTKTFPDGEPIVFHQIRVANLLADWKLDMETISAGLVHNIPSEIMETNLGKKVVDLVRGKKNLEKFTFAPHTHKGKEQQEFCLNAMLIVEPNLNVHLLEAADVFQTILTSSFEEEKLTEEKYVQRAYGVIVPFLKYIGYEEASRELQDIAFLILNGEEYDMIKRFIDSRIKRSLSETEKELKEIENQLISELNKEGITVTRSKTRIKSVVGTRDKIEKREVKDIEGIRIITDTEENCYRSMDTNRAVLKSLGWTEDIDGFRNYIAKPKENGYQSLHLKFTKDGRYLEVQVRTEEMDFVAEVGSAAHWKYKDPDTPTIDIADPTAVSRFKGLREDLLNKGLVYVYDENGKIYELTPDSPSSHPTILDFAFAANQGLQFAGAQILLPNGNWRDIAIGESVDNGSTIRIMTTKQDVTTRERLKFTNTSLARITIQKYLKGEAEPERERTGREFIDSGKRELDTGLDKFRKSEVQKLSRILRELKEKDVKIDVLFSLEGLAKKMGLRSEDDIYMKVGLTNGNKDDTIKEIIGALSDSYTIVGYREPEIKSGKANLWLIVKYKPQIFKVVANLFKENSINLQSIHSERIEEGLFFKCEMIFGSQDYFNNFLISLENVYADPDLVPISHRFSDKTVTVKFEVKRNRIGIAAEIAERMSAVGADFINVDIGPLKSGSFEIKIPFGRREKVEGRLKEELEGLKVRKVITKFRISPS